MYLFVTPSKRFCCGGDGDDDGDSDGDGENAQDDYKSKDPRGSAPGLLSSIIKGLRAPEENGPKIIEWPMSFLVGAHASVQTNELGTAMQANALYLSDCTILVHGFPERPCKDCAHESML